MLYFQLSISKDKVFLLLLAFENLSNILSKS